MTGDQAEATRAATHVLTIEIDPGDNNLWVANVTCLNSPTAIDRDCATWYEESGVPARNCWARVCGGASDAIWDLIDVHDLGVGEHSIYITEAGLSPEYVVFALAKTKE